MDLLIKHGDFECKGAKPFSSMYQHLFASSENYEEAQGAKFNLKRVVEEFGAYNWDGEIAIFEKKDQSLVLEKLEAWFRDEKNHTDWDEGGTELYNCVLLKETQNCLVLIDMQADCSSSMQLFYDQMKNDFPEMVIKYHNDCHLISNLNLGRVKGEEDRAEVLSLLHKEGVIDDTLLFYALGDFHQAGEPLLPTDRPVVLTGKMCIERTHLKRVLTDAGFNVLDTVKAGAWLWLGEDVGASKIKKAQDLGVECTPISEIVASGIEMFFRGLKANEAIRHRLKM
jgi:NAD-dependent DNA ligase